MTGAEFRAMYRRVGLRKIDVAAAFEVSTMTITRIHKSKVVPAVYAFALCWLVCEPSVAMMIVAMKRANGSRPVGASRRAPPKPRA